MFKEFYELFLPYKMNIAAIYDNSYGRVCGPYATNTDNEQI